MSLPKLLPTSIATSEITDLIKRAYNKLLAKEQLPEATMTYLTILATSGAGCSRYWSAANKLKLVENYTILKQKNPEGYSKALVELEALILGQ
jgi:hypothetical protein